MLPPRLRRECNTPTNFTTFQKRRTLLKSILSVRCDLDFYDGVSFQILCPANPAVIRPWADSASLLTTISANSYMSSLFTCLTALLLLIY